MDRKHPLAKCEICPLREVGKYVPSKIPLGGRAQLAMVGEAPGYQEAVKGVPFTGPSGKLLDTVMHHHGIDREEVLLTNACLCRPPDNATPPQSAIAACRDRLVSELETAGVEKAVLLGNSAAQSLLGLTNITRLRVGPPREGRIIPGVKLIPTVHPAACLRQDSFFPFLVQDIGKIGAPDVIWNDPEYIVADTALDAIHLLREVERRTDENEGGTGFLVIDIEVDVEKDIAFDHPNQYGMLCVGIGYAPGKVLVLGESAMGIEGVRDHLKRLLRSRRIVAQNGKFDLAGLYPILGALELWFDTMLASYVFDERAGIHGLKIQAVEYLGAPQYDNEIKQYVGPGIGYGAIPRDKLYKYNATDVAATYDMLLVWLRRFEEHPAGAELRRVHDFLVAASNQLMYLELNGLAVDRTYLNELESIFIESLKVIEQEIGNIVAEGSPLNYDKKGIINPRSPLQVKRFLADIGVTVDSTNEDTLTALIEHLSQPQFKEVPRAQLTIKFAKAMLWHRGEAKSYGTYVKGIRKRLYRGRVYPTFMLHGTTTGRLSCRNPNLQNIPRESSIRRLFIPAKLDNVFIQTDYSQAELRVLSYIAGDTYFRDIFNEGLLDIFDDLTPIVFPNAGTKDQCTPAEWKEYRVRVKAFVYGLAYGRTPEGLAMEYDFTRKEAYEARDNFFSVIPEIVAFLQSVRTDVRAGNDLVTPWGRHRRFMLITKENVKDIMNQAQAFIPQSTASDMCLMAMTNVRQDTKGFAWIRNIVHDSLLLECHPDDVEEVKEITERRMVEAFDYICKGYVKGAVESKVGSHWGEV